MTVGQIFWIIGAILFFLAGVGVNAIPQIVIWGHFCTVLGLLTNGIPCWRPS